MDFFRRTLGTIQRWWQPVADPEQILEQTLWDMEKKLIQMRRAIAQAVATGKRVERHRKTMAEAVQRWQKWAKLALDCGDENLARAAIARRKHYNALLQELEGQRENQQTFVRRVRHDLQALEDEITQIKLRKDWYVTRLRTAIAQQQLQTLQQQLTGKDLEIPMADLELSSWQREAEAELFDPLEAQFRQLEREHPPRK
ncbi:hypothetical protein FLX56_04070 [Synechococcus moorigangaii CMS01]|nr:hypothetical protein [Synechococcus moorigangaii CMS01]